MDCMFSDALLSGVKPAAAPNVYISEKGQMCKF